MTDVALPNVVGLDLSLNGTGIAYPDGTVERYAPVADPKAAYGMARILDVRDRAMAAVTPGLTELVVIEGMAFDAYDRERQLAQLTGIIRAALYESHVPYLICPPGTLKKYATGDGHASKTKVLLAAINRLGYEGEAHDEADALWLRAAGWELLEVPLVALPKAHRDALVALRRTPPAMKDR